MISEVSASVASPVALGCEISRQGCMTEDANRKDETPVKGVYK